MPSPLLKILPPGPSFIINQLLSRLFVSFAASVYLACVGNDVLGLKVPVWVVVSCSILALPCILLSHARYQYWRDGRKAASLGARLIPTIPARLPEGIDLIATWMEAFRTGYIGGQVYPYLIPRGLLELSQAMRSSIGWLRVARRSICALYARPVYAPAPMYSSSSKWLNTVSDRDHRTTIRKGSLDMILALPH